MCPKSNSFKATIALSEASDAGKTSCVFVCLVESRHDSPESVSVPAGPVAGSTV